MDRQNICFFSDDYLPARTGVGISASLTAEELVRAGHRVIVLTSRRRGEPCRETINGVVVYRLWSVCLFGFYQALATPSQIQAILIEHNIGIAHFHYLSLLAFFGAQAAAQLGIAKVLTHHMTVDLLTQPTAMKPFKSIIGWLFHRFTAMMDLATAPSLSFVEKSKSQSPVPLHFISNPMPFRMEDIPTPSAAQPRGEFTILFAGRLGEEKNVPFLLRAFALALKQNPSLKLQIAGTGVQEGALRRLTENLGVASRVDFLGWVDHSQLTDYYSKCDVFVLPSKKEVQPVAALEAMLFGRPIIMADSIDAASEFISNGENGFIVKRDDDRALAGALSFLAADPSHARDMGAAGRERALAADNTAAKVACGFLRIYSLVRPKALVAA